MGIIGTGSSAIQSIRYRRRGRPLARDDKFCEVRDNDYEGFVLAGRTAPQLSATLGRKQLPLAIMYVLRSLA